MTATRVVLRDGGVSVALLARGAVMQDWRVPLHGEAVPVILGYRDAEAYRRDSTFMGAIVGRVANRIGGARYQQDGRPVALVANDGTHQLHGGPGGLWAVDWHLEQLDASHARLTHHSPEGTMGFPGAVDFTVDVALDGFAVTWDMRATASCATPISLAQHNYYALSGNGLGGQRLLVAAGRVLARDESGIMTGGIRAAAGDLDFRAGRQLRGGGERADDFLLFDPGRDPAQPVAEVLSPNGLRLRMWSDQPGAQVYTGQSMPVLTGGHAGRALGPGAGLCLEPSGYPNAVNVPTFPAVLHGPQTPYRQVLKVEIAPT